MAGVSERHVIETATTKGASRGAPSAARPAGKAAEAWRQRCQGSTAAAVAPWAAAASAPATEARTVGRWR